MQKRVNKEDWVKMFRDIGLDDGAMDTWHRLFEQRHPEGHAEFLKWLGIAPEEINKIRDASR